ncbi:MAG: hypothetical protein KIT39_17175, partial [Nitrospirales bacterium]|nr:hypothetical protein [Nitrospirales bacterium]
MSDVALLTKPDEAKDFELNSLLELKTKKEEINALESSLKRKEKELIDLQTTKELSVLRGELGRKEKELIGIKKKFNNLYEERKKETEKNKGEISERAKKSIPAVLKWETVENASMNTTDLKDPERDVLMPSNVAFESRLTGPVATLDFAYKNHKPSDTPVVKLEMNLTAILKPLTRMDVFAHFILADENGNVLFHQKTKDANSNMPLTTLDVLFKQEKSDSGMFSISNAENNKNVYSDRRPSVGNYLDTLPLFHEVKLGDQEYILFAQPSVWTHTKADKKNIPHFILAGLVSAERFRNDTQAIPNPLLLLIVFLLFAIFFCLPLLKLFSMAHEDHVSLLDVLGLMFSSLMLTALLTVSYLDFFIIHQTQDQVDKKLEDTAQRVKSKFLDELKSAIWQLQVFDKSELFTNYFNFAKEENNQRKDKLKNDEETAKVFAKEYSTLRGDLPPLEELGVDLSSYNPLVPFKSVLTKFRREMAETHPLSPPIKFKPVFPIKFKEVFWVDDDGWERVTWNVEDNKNTNSGYRQINLSDREYFKRIKENKEAWRLPWEILDDSPHFFLEPIYSWTTGGNSVILSIPSSHTSQTDSQSDEKPLVAALDFSFDSLMNPIVPSGFGFAVINSEGMVLFHSDSQRNLHENFIQETDQNTQLQSLLHSRGSGQFNGRYWGEERRFHISPLNSDIPWSLVVYHDKAVPQTLNRETLFVFVTLFFLYTFFILGCGLFGLLIFGTLQRGQGAWMWPAPNRGTTYLLVFLGQVLLVFFFFVCTPGKGDVTLLSAFVLPLLGIALMFILLADQQSCISTWIEKLDKKLNHWGKFPGYRTNYTLMVLGFMLLYSAVPTFAFFTVAFNQEMKLHTMHSLHNLARAWDQHTIFLSERMAKEGGNPVLNDTDRQLAPCSQSSNGTYAFVNLPLYSLKFRSEKTPEPQNCGGEKGAGLPLTITTQPSSVRVTAPALATFTVVATGEPPLTYQWHRQDPGGGRFADIEGATSDTYTTPATTIASDDGAQFQVVVTNGAAAKMTSDTATLSVQPMSGGFIDWFHLKMRIFSNLIAIQTGSYLPLKAPSPRPGWTWSSNSNEPRSITLSKSFPAGEVVQISGLSPNSKSFLSPSTGIKPVMIILACISVIGALLWLCRKYPPMAPTVGLFLIIVALGYLAWLIWENRIGKGHHEYLDPFLFWGTV